MHTRYEHAVDEKIKEAGESSVNERGYFLSN